MDTEIVEYIYTYEYSSTIKNEENLGIYNLDRPWGHYAEMK